MKLVRVQFKTTQMGKTLLLIKQGVRYVGSLLNRMRLLRIRMKACMSRRVIVKKDVPSILLNLWISKN